MQVANTPVVIADYDPHWPEMYEEERARIIDAIGTWLVDIQHVGSTSVPGMAAKPVVDIMPGVRTLDDDREFIGPMEALGYNFLPVDEDDIPERRYFRRGDPRLFHVHIAEIGGEFWNKHLAFRDYLRAHPDTAAEYATLKRRLAAEYGSDRLGYTNAKSEFILGIEEKAAAAPSPSSLAVERGINGQPASRHPRSTK
jgi:GrpB-like predicted nucleotidyltransferase (UPF0157 family)